MNREYVIDLSKNKKLNESFLRMFGFLAKTVLGRIFGTNNIPVKIKGTRSEVSAFTRAIGSEKRYLESLRDYGLDSPRTYKNKSSLNKAIKGFEEKTGLKWPFV